MPISNAYRKYCVRFLWRFRIEWDFFLGKFGGTYGFSLIRLYFASQRDIHATDNKPFAKFLASTEIPNLFPYEQNSDRENYSVVATV